jgi:hypothetical protein
MDALTVSIKHCVEADFFDNFRADLAASGTSVIILSPFVSPSRCSNYYPVLHALTARTVNVDIYVRPEFEQPEVLRHHFGTVVRGLELSGAQIHTRPTMHEKIAVIDETILWHGSLNILSHNDSRESMLRFESTNLAREVLSDVGLIPIEMEEGTQAAGNETAAMAEAPSCPICGKSMREYKGAGIWICPDSPGCEGTRPISEIPAGLAGRRGTPTLSLLDIACPLCHSKLAIRIGIIERIVCSSPACNFALESKLSAGIIRILRRKGHL